MSIKYDRDEEHCDREIENIGIVGAMAEGNLRFAVSAIRKRQVRLEEMTKINLEERRRIRGAQLTDVLGAYAISFSSPQKRDEFRKAFGLGKPKTSAKWLNEILKAITCCDTKDASYLAIIIKLALHLGIHVVDFPAFYAAKRNEKDFVDEYKKLTRNKRPEPPENQSSSSADVLEQAVSNPTPSTSATAKYIVQPLVNETPKLNEIKRVFGFRRDFNLIAGNPEVSNRLEAALQSGGNKIVGSRYSMILMVDKFGITALKVTACDG